MRTELDRKSIHIVSAILPLSFLFMPKMPMLILISAGTAVFVSMDFFRRWSTALNTIFHFLAAWAMRESEEREFKLTGATWMMLSMTLLFWTVPTQIAIASMLILHWGDAAAALVGKKWGRIRWIHSHTLEGTLTFIFTGLAVLLIGFPELPLIAVLAAVIAAALAESLIQGIDDNLTIPVTAALFLMLLS